MTVPRITHILNNGLLHALTPELRTEIKLLAQDQSTLNSQFMPAYESLKRQFAEFYEFSSPETFTWKQLDILISSCSTFDLQLILGPVLRSVMFDLMKANQHLVEEWLDEGKDEDAESFISDHTTLLENGCYDSLDPDAVFVFMVSFLGFSMAYHYPGSEVAKLPGSEDVNKLALFADRPCIDLYYRGEIQDPQDYYWERTADETEREDYEHDEDTHLRDVAQIFGAETLTHTEVGFELLKIYMRKLAHAADHLDEDPTEICDGFHLTVTQVKKFLFNYQHVPKEQAIRFLGPITADAKTIIADIPDSENADYDLELLAILDQRDPRSAYYKWPLKKQTADSLFEIADKILPVPVPLSPKSRVKDDDLSTIYGSPQSYFTVTPSHPNSCNIQDLYSETHLFSAAGKKKPFSTQKGSPGSALSVKLFPNTETRKRQDFSKISYSSNFQPPSPAGNSFFWLRAMQFCLVLGGACAIVALLTCPPAAAYFGLTSVLGIATTEISVAATFLASTSALVAASLFAVHKITNEGVPPSATPRLSAK